MVQSIMMNTIRRTVTGQNMKKVDVTDEVVLSDISDLVDSQYLSDTDLNLWKPIPYETEGFSGVMLGCGEGLDPTPITIRLNVAGDYRVWLGIYSYCTLGNLRVKLTDDLCCQTISPPKKMDRISEPIFHEMFWKQADLTDQDMILQGGAHKPDLYPAALAYIRLEPIDNAAAPETSPEKVRYLLAVTNDGHGIMGAFPHKRPEDLLESFESVPKDCCMQILLWGVHCADVCNYPTKVGVYQSAEPGPRLNSFDNTYFNNLRLWQDKGWDSLRLVRDYAKGRGWQFHAYIRMGAFAAQFPLDYIQSEFFRDNPEYHCRDREGRAVIRLSYAYPKVQEHMIRLVKEIADYDPDGVSLCLVRGVPLVLYEPIMVEGFKKQYGIDPRHLDECDQRWLDYQAGVVTSFMQKVKLALKPGQRLSAMVPANEHDCRRWGLDVADWVKRGIVDDLYPLGQRFNEDDVHVDCPENLDFAYFNQLQGREQIRLIPMLYPWDKYWEDIEGWRQIVLSFLEQGADAYGVWDAVQDGTYAQDSQISQVGYLGYPSKPKPPCIPKFRKVKIVTMDGFRYDRYHYFEVV